MADRFRQAQEDRHQLFDYHRHVQDSHPEYGSWDGHREAYERRREDLRRALERWENDDDCRFRRLSTAEQQELDDAREYAGKDFPSRPVPTMRTVHESEPELRERVSRALLQVGVPAFAVGFVVGLVIAALADPEPFSKLVLILGTAATVALLGLLGRATSVSASLAETDGEPVAPREDSTPEQQAAV